MGLMSANLVPLVSNGQDIEGKQAQFPVMIKDPGQELTETYKSLLVLKIPQAINSLYPVQLFATPHRMQNVFNFFLASIIALFCNNSSPI